MLLQICSRILMKYTSIINIISLQTVLLNISIIKLDALVLLQVDGVDLRNASHDRAVEVIKNSSSPVQFCVQSLMDPLWVSPNPE